MESCVIEAKALADWVMALERSYDLVGPVQGADHLVRFRRVREASEIIWDYTGSILPPKKYFLPAEELLFDFDRLGTRRAEEPAESRRVILGLHPCDLHAFQRLDRAMADGVRDDGYFARRERSILVGTNCLPDEFCFCNGLGTARPPEGGWDIFLNRLDGRILIETGTPAGKSLLALLPEKRKTDAEDSSRRKAFEKERESRFRQALPAADGKLKKLLETGEEHPCWQELAGKCLSCSACTAVCPTCFCFDVWDEIDLEGSAGRRVRRWDSCQLLSFTKVASGEVFRKKRSERVRHRFFRKFVYLEDRYHSPFCVGCGRCGRACPAGIRVPETLRALARPAAPGERS